MYFLNLSSMPWGVNITGPPAYNLFLPMISLLRYPFTSHTTRKSGTAQGGSQWWPAPERPVLHHPLIWIIFRDCGMVA